MKNLGTLIALQNRIDIMRKLMQDPEANAEILGVWAQRPSYSDAVLSAPLLYINGLDSEELVKQANGRDIDFVNYALVTLEAHRAAGVDPMALSREIMNQYGLNPTTWTYLQRL